MVHPTQPEGPDLEEQFFAEQNRRLLEELRGKKEKTQQREALRAIFATKDDGLLDQLLALGVGPETGLALTLVPVVAVAWADGKMDAQERKAILDAAAQGGIEEESPARSMLESWLEQRVPTTMVQAWKKVIRSLWADLDDDQRRTLREKTIGAARRVAEASGGILSLTTRVSASERAVLDDLEKTLS